MRDNLDRYYTPFGLARACVAALSRHEAITSAWEPSVGGGAFAVALRDLGVSVGGCDIDPQAVGLADVSPAVRCDFVDVRPETIAADWVIGNPPYRDAERHMRHALIVARRHVAMLLRASFLGSRGRARDFWPVMPLRRVWWINPRPSFTPDGRTDGAEYAFFWLDKCHSGPAVIDWLSWDGSTDEREHLERAGQVGLFGGES